MFDFLFAFVLVVVSLFLAFWRIVPSLVSSLNFRLCAVLVSGLVLAFRWVCSVEMSLQVCVAVYLIRCVACVIVYVLQCMFELAVFVVQEKSFEKRCCMMWRDVRFGSLVYSVLLCIS